MTMTAHMSNYCVRCQAYVSLPHACFTFPLAPSDWSTLPTAPPQPMTWPAVVPPVCTGTGTQDADFSLVSDGMRGEGRCGICGQRVRLYDGQHLVTHPYRLPSDPAFVAPAAEAGGER
jgi:hypothetical protein